MASASMIVRVRPAAGDAAPAEGVADVMGDLGNTRFSTLGQIRRN
jgi:hypothetical protein